MLVHNKKTYDYVVDNFPESLIAQSINDLKDEESNVGIGFESREKSKNEEESTGVKLKRRMSSLLKGQKPILKKKQKDLVPQDTSKPLLAETCVSIPAASRGNKKIAEDKIQRLHNLKIRRQSMTYRGACLSTPRYHMKASSCPDIYKNTIVDDAPEEEGCAKELSRSMTKCCSLKYITIPFIVFCFSNFILYFWYVHKQF